MSVSNKKWKIYIVGHKKIYPQLVQKDRGFNNENYCFLNVGQAEKLENSEPYECIQQKNLDHFMPIGKYWAESEGIYNIWRSGIWKELEYVGFLHYDIEFRVDKRFFWGKKSNITERIEKYIADKNKSHISFATYTPKQDYAQNIMADITRPNELTGDGKNCYEVILEDYNHYFKTSYGLEDFLKRKKLNLCSCFLIDTATFDKMMKFFDWIVQTRKLEVFDTEHQYRFQGGMAERYFGVFLLFEYPKTLDLMLVHQYDQGWK